MLLSFKDSRLRSAGYTLPPHKKTLGIIGTHYDGLCGTR
jgi:hypothetical protein